jgi:hypothetical protein
MRVIGGLNRKEGALKADVLACHVKTIYQESDSPPFAGLKISFVPLLYLYT